MIGRLCALLGWHRDLRFEPTSSNWDALRTAASTWRPTWEEIQIAKAQAQVAARVRTFRRAQ